MGAEDIAAIFAEMADVLEILGEDRFRINSYRKSARVIEETPEDIAALSESGRLQDLPGIGKATAAKITEYLQTGKVRRHEELRKKIPPGLLELLTVQGLGPKTIAKLWKQAKITSLDDLRAALAEHADRLEAVEGMGAKKVAQLAESISFAESVSGRFRLDEAGVVADALRETVSACNGAGRVEVAGSFRRRRETVGDIDILCESGEKDAPKIIAAFTAADGVTKVLAAGATKASVVIDGRIQADLRVVPTGSFGSALQYFTGSKAHNVALREIAVKRKMKLNEYGLFKETASGLSRQIAGGDEEGIYSALGLEPIRPELREDRGELTVAAKGNLPKLIGLKDIRGDLHMHTTASDGSGAIEEMIRACRAMGYKYMAITDHSKSQVQANGLDEARLERHVAAIRTAAKKYKDILVLTGIEVDIFKDGSLDFSDDVLAELDFVTASPHSALSQGRTEATRRLIRAIENPYVHVIGHPTGRLINKRAGMEIDIAKVAEAAAANDTALEVNAHPWRLDLRDVHIRVAVDAGAKLLICTDAHSAAGGSDLSLMRFGVDTARRGWATAADVINTRTPAALKKWLKR
ncbi:MAG: DNA polymerase/3'-5' exonuclease PolX [Planctomycetota bacterium]|nr:DNA polymerase/3'-5' exonuclease PolX [Planctomycetota bacterium]